MDWSHIQLQREIMWLWIHTPAHRHGSQTLIHRAHIYRLTSQVPVVKQTHTRTHAQEAVDRLGSQPALVSQRSDT